MAVRHQEMSYKLTVSKCSRLKKKKKKKKGRGREAKMHHLIWAFCHRHLHMWDLESQNPTISRL